MRPAVCSLWEELSTLRRIVFESESRQAACRRSPNSPNVVRWHTHAHADNVTVVHGEGCCRKESRAGILQQGDPGILQ